MSAVLHPEKPALRVGDVLPYFSFGLLAAGALVVLFSFLKIVALPYRFFQMNQSKTAQSLEALKAAPNSTDSIESLTAPFETHSLFYVPKGEMITQGPGLAEILKPFHLIGIVQGDKPEALIQNASTQQTYFTRAGEKFDQFVVKEIRDNSLDVEYAGQIQTMPLEEGTH